MSPRAVQAALLSLSAMLWSGLTNGSPLAPRDVSICKLPADQSVWMSSGFGYEGDCVRSKGHLTGFMMFVDFPDAPHSEESAQHLYDLFFPEVANWFRYASYGKLSLDVKADTTAFYRMPASSSSYPINGGLTDAQHQRYIADAIGAFTFNGQNMPTADVLYIVPTTNAKDIAWSYTYNDRAIDRDGTVFASRTVTLGWDAYNQFGFLVLNHETGHAMCLPDLYPASARTDGHVEQYVGGWDMMADILGPSPDFFAWDKWRLGWLADDAIACIFQKGVTRHVLTPLYSDAPGIKAVVLARSRSSALVAEYRLDGGIDTATCSPGLLLYTVDTKVPALGGPIRVIDANPNTYGCDRDALNDATLNINGTKILHVPDFGVTVEIVSQFRKSIIIDVDLG